MEGQARRNSSLPWVKAFADSGSLKVTASCGMSPFLYAVTRVLSPARACGLSTVGVLPSEPTKLPPKALITSEVFTVRPSYGANCPA
ncbi:Uncharacterised protein [Mycobacteroides abscessus subsp. abscessus]|nr:Uncharacterised protein [Mycobacteroides abscessus subsp. abscessus]